MQTILFALVLALIGMGVVMLFLAALVLLLIGIKKADGLVSRFGSKLSSTPRTKVATEPSEDAGLSAEGVDEAEKLSREKEELARQEELRQLLAAAVSTYLILKDKDAQRAGDKRRRRNVWSIAGKYEILSQRMTGGKNYNF